MPFDATDFGYVSILRDNADLDNSTNTKVGGASCIWGFATTTMNMGDAVVIDTTADFSYATTTSASATSGAGFVVAHTNVLLGPNQWDFQTAAAIGDRILIVKSGRVAATASAAIVRGARVGTSTTAGRVVTTTTQDAALGKAVSASTLAGDTIYIDVNA
jgi:hypothetical protein